MALDGIQLSAGILVNSPESLDVKYGPFSSTGEAISNIDQLIRYPGLTVGVLSGGFVNEYWFQDGVNLVLKSVGGSSTVDLSNVLYTTGDQTISGAKDFDQRPTVDGTGVLLQGEGGSTIASYPSDSGTYLYSFDTQVGMGEWTKVNEIDLDTVSTQNVVYTTGDQIISGFKSFVGSVEVGNGSTEDATLFVSGKYVGINNESPIANLDVSGTVAFNTRPTVNGTGILLSGDLDTSNFYTNDNPSGFITGVENVVYTTGDQIIGGIKSFDEKPFFNGLHSLSISVSDTPPVGATGVVWIDTTDYTPYNWVDGIWINI